MIVALGGPDRTDPSPPDAWGGKILSSGESEQLLDPVPVKADDHLPIDECDRRGANPQFDQFGQRLLIFSDVLLRVLHTFLRKKLFLVVTGGSAGLGIDDHLFRHDLLLSILHNRTSSEEHSWKDTEDSDIRVHPSPRKGLISPTTRAAKCPGRTEGRWPNPRPPGRGS